MGSTLEWSARTRRQENRLPLRGVACVIEPDDDERGQLCEVLRAMGFTAHETASGQLGLFIATQVQLNVLVVSLRLTDMSGLKLIRRLRAISDNATIIALSNDTRSSLPLMLARFAGADVVIAAPPSSEALGIALVEAAHKPGRAASDGPHPHP